MLSRPSQNPIRRAQQAGWRPWSPSARRPGSRCRSAGAAQAPSGPYRPPPQRAATTALACWRLSSASAISGAYASRVVRDSITLTPALAVISSALSSRKGGPSPCVSYDGIAGMHSAINAKRSFQAELQAGLLSELHPGRISEIPSGTSGSQSLRTPRCSRGWRRAHPSFDRSKHSHP